jgi:hypothetical protein
MGTFVLDIGGWGIKGAPVDLETGELVGERILATIEALFWPDLIIVGGGVSKKADKFVPKLETRAKILSARMLNSAGIAGATLAPEAFPRYAPRVAPPG